MSILLTNDDGIEAPGIIALAEALTGIDDIIVVAPLHNNSGVGHSITLHRSLKTTPFDCPPYVTERIAINGSPADAVKFAFTHHCKPKPKLVVSGINNGPNIGVNTHYSGTVGAALEGLIQGACAVAVSVEGYNKPDFAAGMRYGRIGVEIALELMEQDTMHKPFCLNINIPDIPSDKIRGIRFTRNGSSGFSEFFVQHEQHDKNEYAIDGVMKIQHEETESDAVALAEGYVSITPLHLEMTDNIMLDLLRKRKTHM